MSNVSISKETVVGILKDIINPDMNDHNRDIIMRHLVTELSSDSVDFLIYLKYNSLNFQLLEVGDYVAIPNHCVIHFSDMMNVDIMQDLGIYRDQFTCFGVVKGHAGWRSDYNNTSAKLKVNVFVHNDDKEVIKQEVEVLHSQLEKVSINSIKHFNDAQD